MSMSKYTTALGSGEGIVEESLILFDLWKKGMDISSLNQLALQSGRFQKLTARRIRNLVTEGFAPRFLANDGASASSLKILKDSFSLKEFSQLLFLYTCRKHTVLFDFIVNVYWNAYATGRETISNEESREFLIRAVQDGITTTPWSENMINRVAGYLTGTLADFGLLEDGRKSVRQILSFRIEPRVAIYLAYDLHFSGLGDNAVLSNSDWALFGLDRDDVLNELKRLALKGWFIIQAAGDVTRIGWQYQSMEELIDAFIKG